MSTNNELFSIALENIKLNFVVHDESFVRRQKRSWERGLHSHVYYEILYSFSDDSRLFLENREFMLKKNSFAIMRPFQKHKSSSEEDTDMISIGFYYERSRTRGRNDLYSMLEGKLNGKDYIGVAKQEIGPLFLQIRSLLADRNMITEGLVLGLLTQIFYSVLDEVGIEEKTTQNTLSEQSDHKHFKPRNASFNALCEINDILHSHYTKDITPQSLSEEYRISTKQINRYMLSQYGQTFLQRRTGLRIAAAQTLLRESDATIGEIAEQVGYHSINTFYSAFRIVCGVTPDQYRRSDFHTMDNFSVKQNEEFVNIASGTDIS